MPRRRSPRLPALVSLVIAAGVVWFLSQGGTALLGPLGDDVAAAPPLAPGASDAIGGPAAPAPAGGPARPAEAFPLTVDHVYDGDTLWLRAETPTSAVPTTEAIKVRLIGVDTPEIGANAECYGVEATNALRALAPAGGRVWATPDRDLFDRYDRYLLYLWTDDGRFIEHELVASGAAEAMRVEPNDAHFELLTAAEQSASAAGAGQWGVC